MATKTRRTVKVQFVSDEDVEFLIQPLSAVNLELAGKCSQQYTNSEKTGVRRNPGRQSRRKTEAMTIAEEVDDDDEHEEILRENCNDSTILPTDAPKEALLGDSSVVGQHMFGFQTPKRRNGLIQKALQSAQTPERGSTPRKSVLAAPTTPTSSRVLSRRTTPQRRLSLYTPQKKTKTPARGLQTPSTRLRQIDVDNAKTPYNLRKRIGKKISSMINNESDSDISSSESEFCPSDENEGADSENEEEQVASNEDSEVSDSNSNSKSDENEYHNRPTKKHQRLRQTDSSPISTKETEYRLQPQQYFGTHNDKKCQTSGRLLKTRLSQDVLQKLLSEVPEKHSKAIAHLCRKHLKLFPHWQFALREGFSILLYGVGSKRKLLQSFQETVMEESDVLVVNGFFPSLAINEVVTTIARNILELSHVPTDLHECIDAVLSWYSGAYKNSLYLIVHNIDGEMLRSDKCQDVLCRLANAPNIYLVASVDHINASLVWDQVKLSSFNFTWWDVTNFLPYFTETSFECSVMVKNTGSLALSSLKNVFKALTANARNIFLLIAQRHIENKENNNFRGVLFRDLYRACRDALLVSSDLALRSQLTDFIDHNLLKSRRGADGSEYLHIPVDVTVLSQLVSENNSDV